jgi:nucleoside-diphosphate-sugar epimerase
MRTNYLIFGGEGFIGQHLTNHISNINSNTNILSLDIRNNKLDNAATYQYCDVRKPVELNLEKSSDSVIFNLAAVHTTPGHPDNEYFETNIYGAERICDFARKNGINTIVFTSSIAPYGPSEELKSESTIPMPNIPYGISKLVAEHIHKTWQAEDAGNRKLFIVRPGVVFGKGEGGNYTRLYWAMRKKQFFYPGRKDTIKGCVYVKDVARILYEGATKNEKSVDTYNLTLSPAPRIDMICETMAEATNINPPKILVPAWFLKLAAGSLYYLGRLFGKKINGIHPDRVKKLMISTNIDGSKLSNSPYKLQFTLKEAIEDWFSDCKKKGLS